jgi:ubiquinone/menaquinone biosynthesis C-methylase UbiE
LDIGGGGEGVIGKLKGDRVIATDPSHRELEEAPNGPLKIVMDARELKFLDSSFETVTSFFTMMYIPYLYHGKVFSEIYRVLAPGGKFLLWDVIIPPNFDQEKEIAVFLFKFILPEDEIETGYGTTWTKDGRDKDHFSEIAKKVGFEVVSGKEEGMTFYLELQKRYFE